MLSKSNSVGVLHVDMVPIVGSLYYSRNFIHICGGLVTTFYSAELMNQVPGNGELRITRGAHLQMGIELSS